MRRRADGDGQAIESDDDGDGEQPTEEAGDEFPSSGSTAWRGSRPGPSVEAVGEPGDHRHPGDRQWQVRELRRKARIVAHREAVADGDRDDCGQDGHEREDHHTRHRQLLEWRGVDRLAASGRLECHESGWASVLSV